MYPKTVLTAPPGQFSYKNDLVVQFFDGDVVIPYPAERVLHLIQLMIMGGKKGFGLEVGMLVYIFHHCPGNGYPIVCACSPANFVKYDQAATRKVVQDTGCLIHLNHKSGFAKGNIVACPYPGENFINKANFCFRSRDK